ncbi:electron transport complex subunit RsxG [Oceaniserpentilla sp. 4NH20-0058]|uniref:electron transport complex subunit RsxG n=1 Tax=Oceaniserpentilla sp. 4NH20-0058 TaxID=3127660 RepID=UPI003108C7D1
MTDQANTENQEPTLIQSISKNAIGLAIFAFVTAGVIAIVQLNTKQTILDNIAKAQAKALYEITPKESVDNDILQNYIELNSEQAKKNLHVNYLGPIADDAKLYLAQKEGQTHTFLFPVTAPDGYTTHIQLLVGIKVDGTIAGVRVVDHKETPGLGDKVELKKSKWILSFNDTSLISPSEENWEVKKDGGQFDSFTGATITPRAVIHAVKRALVMFEKDKAILSQLQANTAFKSGESL